jgi:hypothetical protein
MPKIVIFPEKVYEELEKIEPKNRAFNIWLNLVDELLEKKVAIEQAMILAAQRLQAKQAEYQKNEKIHMFHPADLQLALQDAQLLLQRTDAYKLLRQQMKQTQMKP